MHLVGNYVNVKNIAPRRMRTSRFLYNNFPRTSSTPYRISISDMATKAATTLDAAIEELLQTYNDLNSSIIDEFHEAPTPLEFMQYVARNCPFVVRGGASHWAASRLWNAEYLTRMMGERHVKIAVTPHGSVYSGGLIEVIVVLD